MILLIPWDLFEGLTIAPKDIPMSMYHVDVDNVPLGFPFTLSPVCILTCNCLLNNSLSNLQFGNDSDMFKFRDRGLVCPVKTDKPQTPKVFMV